jgi:hypothetical protein
MVELVALTIIDGMVVVVVVAQDKLEVMLHRDQQVKVVMDYLHHLQELILKHMLAAVAVVLRMLVVLEV